MLEIYLLKHSGIGPSKWQKELGVGKVAFPRHRTGWADPYSQCTPGPSASGIASLPTPYSSFSWEDITSPEKMRIISDIFLLSSTQ